jgi:hypothetical protein
MNNTAAAVLILHVGGVYGTLTHTFGARICGRIPSKCMLGLFIALSSRRQNCRNLIRPDARGISTGRKSGTARQKLVTTYRIQSYLQFPPEVRYNPAQNGTDHPESLARLRRKPW